MYHIHKYSYRFLFLLSIAAILYATLYREAGQGDIELRLFWTINAPGVNIPAIIGI